MLQFKVQLNSLEFIRRKQKLILSKEPEGTFQFCIMRVRGWQLSNPKEKFATPRKNIMLNMFLHKEGITVEHNKSNQT